MKNEERMQISLNQIQITDCFFGRYIALVRNTILEYQWKALNDQIEGAAPSHCIDNVGIRIENSLSPDIQPDCKWRFFIPTLVYTLPEKLDMTKRVTYGMTAGAVKG